jgi:hypothetical protein
MIRELLHILYLCLPLLNRDVHVFHFVISPCPCLSLLHLHFPSEHCSVMRTTTTTTTTAVRLCVRKTCVSFAYFSSRCVHFRLVNLIRLHDVLLFSFLLFPRVNRMSSSSALAMDSSICQERLLSHLSLRLVSRLNRSM